MTEERSHSELPPSSSDKWMICHAWRRLNHGIEDVTSEAAEEGTLGHELLAEHLLGVCDLAGSSASPEMYDYLMSCVDWCNAQPGSIHVEYKVDFGAPYGFIDLTGTADVMIDTFEDLTVADLKYGKGVVEVAGNFQLMTYLVGAMHKFGRRPKYRLVILQPRAWHKDGPIREHWVTDPELRNFEHQLERAIEGNYDPRAKATPGDHCRNFCKALSRCPAAARYSIEAMLATPEDI